MKKYHAFPFPLLLLSIGISFGFFACVNNNTSKTDGQKVEKALDTKKPNIIYIMSDDHSPYAIGAYGSRLAKLNPTPNLDEFAAQGILYENVFVTNSICTPSRASIITGQYSQTNGVLDLDGRLPEAKQYLPKEMKKLGYQTAMIGKWHLKDAPDAFDYYKVLPVQGKYFDPTFITREPGDTVENIYFHGGISRTVNITRTKGHSTDVITDITLDWLENKREKDKPFFLMHHYKAPHDFFEYAPRYSDYLTDIKVPESPNMYRQNQPNWGSIATKGTDEAMSHTIGTSVSDRHNYRNYVKRYGIKTKPRDSATSEAYQRYAKDYLRCVKGVDDNLKRLFQYLKDHDLWENTIIVYTGDQGMMLGEHDLIDKRWMYEESMRMPFILSYPAKIKEGRKTDRLINNTDFAPTLIELAGGKTPEYMQGISFANSVEDPQAPELRKDTYYRYWMHLTHHDVPAHFGVRTKKYKLIFYYAEHWDKSRYGHSSSYRGHKGPWNLIRSTPKAWELYDIEKDPHENNNVYKDPAYADIVKTLKERLLEMRKEINEEDKDPRLEKVIQEHWND